MAKDRTFWGVLGVIIFIGGIIGTIPLVMYGPAAWLPLTALIVIGGILLIAWAYTR